jgi:cytochrome c
MRKLAVVSVVAMSPVAQALAMPDWIKLPTYDCRTCHAVETKLIGPALKDIALRYKGDAAAAEMLKGKVRSGGAGNWNEITGGVPMTPHPNLSDEDLGRVIEYILSLGD